jgi:hypothetical protein
MRNRRNVALVLFVSLLACPAQAWDALGHGLAAAVGAKLTARADWRAYFASREKLLAAAAAFPDTVFRPQSTAKFGSETEAPLHYFHLDHPAAAKGPEQVTCEVASREGVGLAPWRAEQFEKLARESARSGKFDDTVYELGVATHYVSDQAVPWHSATDAHGEGSGHPNIHIFIEGCADAFLNEKDPRYDPEFARGIETGAKLVRKQLQKKLKGPLGVRALLIEELRISSQKRKEFEALDTPDTFLNGAPPPGTKKEDEKAKRKPEACLRFKDAIGERLAHGAAFVSLFLDEATSKWGKPKASPQLPETAIHAYAERPYIPFSCAR